MLGLVLVVVASVHQLTSGQPGTAGIPAGDPLRPFVAPLATSTLEGDANIRPACRVDAPNPRALNVCGRGRLVLALVSPRSGSCVREVSTLQSLRASLPPSIQFAAVAVGADRAETARLVRRYHWTIPVAYDRDGAVGQLYGVVVCPIVELASGGRIVDRLVGDRWLAAAVLEARLRRLAALG